MSLSLARTLPCCGYAVDAATDIESKDDLIQPRPGDFTICLKCGAWLRFTDDGVRKFEAEDILDLKDEQLAKMRLATKLIQEKNE